MTKPTVVIADYDYDYGDVDIERAIVEDAGPRLVADHAMALLPAAARKICGYDRATRWQYGEPICRTRPTSPTRRSARSASSPRTRWRGC